MCPPEPDNAAEVKVSSNSQHSPVFAIPSVKTNIIANLAGHAWTSVMMLVFVPFYISIMGAESYGVVGIYISLQSIFFALDLGLPQSLNRELAHLCGQKADRRRMADTVRTLELVYWSTGLLIALAVLAASRFLAYQWVNPETLSPESLAHAIRIMALLLCIKWPVSLYTGGLNGLQRQVAVNIIVGVTATLQGFGAIGILWWVDPTVNAFLMWQVFVTLLQVISLRTVLNRAVSSAGSGRFRPDVLRQMWRFAAGLTAASLVAMVLTQVDKVLLSRMLPLADFGIYTFATAVAAVLYRLIAPVFTSYYPRLTRLVAAGSVQETIRTYHQASQVIAVMVLPAAVAGAFFSSEILILWTSGRELNAEAAVVLSLLLIGNLFHGLAHIPYALQIAHGWTRLSLYINCIGLVLAGPALYWGVTRYGASGAAGCWCGISFLLTLLGVCGMHFRLLPEERNRWFLQDVLAPFTAAVLVTGCGRLLLNEIDVSRLQTASLILFTLLSGYAAAALACREVRNQVVSLLMRIRERLAATEHLHQQEA